ncbi:MAG TPA: DUF3857 domain-containing protein [Chitinophagaceae bacterium]|nr:DUF3857 domain-containing protein [Chitinophagaceae bacterium]
MISIKPTVLFAIAFTANISYGQTEFPAFGSFTASDVNMKECSFDPEAEAIILLDKAVAGYDDDYRLITERRIRIKILNQKGIERANISIPFYSRDDYENISRVEAYTYNFDEAGRPSFIPIDKKSFYTERTNSYWSQMKFAMPVVKVGSIIEYHYVSTMKSYGGLDEWRFQSEIPTLTSSFLLQMVPTHEFTYSVQKSNKYRIIIQPLPNDGRIYFEMSNIPGLRKEPYMDAPRDYLQKVIFQHSAYLTSFGSKQKTNTTWKDVAYDLMTDKNYGSQLDKDLKIDAIKVLIANEPTATAKLKVVYDYVKKNVAWNGIDTWFSRDPLKTVWDRKNGTSGEMNLLLVNLLNSAGIETYPVLAAERHYGKIDTTFPFIERFNKTVAFALADGRQYILDASQENCPVGLTPFPLLGTTAFLVDKKKFNLLRIAPGSKYYTNIITINGELDTGGVLTAETNVQSYDYARQFVLNEIKSDKRKFIAEVFENPYDGISIDSFLITPPEFDSLPVAQYVRFKQQLNQAGGFALLNPNLFARMEKSPFISSIRFTNVNFGYPYNITVQETFKVPPGTKIDPPEDKAIRSNDKSIEAFKQVRFENNEIKVIMRFVQTTTLVPAENYTAIKDFYKKMIDMLNEPVLVKLAN